MTTYLRLLQSLLVENMQSGVEAAVRVCSDTAQDFTAERSKRYGVHVRRAALRWRNSHKQVDSLESFWIKQFQRWKYQGIALDTYVIVQKNKTLRLLKPIVITNPICLLCHETEEDMLLGIRALLAQRYPPDRARWFRLGDVRGVLSLESTIGKDL